jgi:hypothetical protein
MINKIQKCIETWASSINKDDLLLINNALNEIINGPDAIADYEFQTRTGVEFKEAEKLLKRTGLVLDELNKF